LEIFHFALRLGRFVLLSIDSCQREMGLRSKIAFLFNREQFEPGFLGSR